MIDSYMLVLLVFDISSEVYYQLVADLYWKVLLLKYYIDEISEYYKYLVYLLSTWEIEKYFQSEYIAKKQLYLVVNRVRQWNESILSDV